MSLISDTFIRLVGSVAIGAARVSDAAGEVDDDMELFSVESKLAAN